MTECKGEEFHYRFAFFNKIWIWDKALSDSSNKYKSMPRECNCNLQLGFTQLLTNKGIKTLSQGTFSWCRNLKSDTLPRHPDWARNHHSALILLHPSCVVPLPDQTPGTEHAKLFLKSHYSVTQEGQGAWFSPPPIPSNCPTAFKKRI